MKTNPLDTNTTTAFKTIKSYCETTAPAVVYRDGRRKGPSEIRRETEVKQAVSKLSLKEIESLTNQLDKDDIPLSDATKASLCKRVRRAEVGGGILGLFRRVFNIKSEKDQDRHRLADSTREKIKEHNPKEARFRTTIAKWNQRAIQSPERRNNLPAERQIDAILISLNIPLQDDFPSDTEEGLKNQCTTILKQLRDKGDQPVKKPPPEISGNSNDEILHSLLEACRNAMENLAPNTPQAERKSPTQNPE